MELRRGATEFFKGAPINLCCARCQKCGARAPASSMASAPMTWGVVYVVYF